MSSLSSNITAIRRLSVPEYLSVVSLSSHVPSHANHFSPATGKQLPSYYTSHLSSLHPNLTSAAVDYNNCPITSTLTFCYPDSVLNHGCSEEFKSFLLIFLKKVTRFNVFYFRFGGWQQLCLQFNALTRDITRSKPV